MNASGWQFWRSALSLQWSHFHNFAGGGGGKVVAAFRAALNVKHEDFKTSAFFFQACVAPWMDRTEMVCSSVVQSTYSKTCAKYTQP